MIGAAAVSANGQITVPAAVRRELGLEAGDHVAFVHNEFGDIVVVKPVVTALVEAQRAAAARAAETEQAVNEIDRLASEALAAQLARRDARRKSSQV
ncbi:MAG: AbrB/MazE/SpoVT family DNA-binding domain-containing protein [Bifidobacteriaceae bacterium]|jgi:AbrB family looped-hinge helix DNA binding protein|nr:AbrB/MazE/SpoVT family DNA-binding domain-containing protein [Bifidobacteriaceae bacterium]